MYSNTKRFDWSGLAIPEEVDAIRDAKVIIINRIPITGKRHSTKRGAKRMPKDAIATLIHAYNYLNHRGCELLASMPND